MKKKDIELRLKRTNGKVTLTVINRKTMRFCEYTDKDIAELKNIKECCDVLLDGFAFAIYEIEKEI